MSFNLNSYLVEKRRLVDHGLHQIFHRSHTCPRKLWNSMKYSVFAGGKRLRPILCLASAEAVGLPTKEALRIACGLELIHTYSLIHDDLPALDNDDYRRGRKTNHIVFGDAMAILAGDGLLTLAFEWISNPLSYHPIYRINLSRVVFELAHFAGYAGMVGGQVDDLLAEKQTPSLSKVRSIHRRKTGAMLLSSVRLPALLSGTSRPKLKALTHYGWSAGLAFQIVDDILNKTGSKKSLGKSTGSDQEHGKMTYLSAIGLKRSREEVEKLTYQAVQALKPFGTRGHSLKELVSYMSQRTS